MESSQMIYPTHRMYFKLPTELRLIIWKYIVENLKHRPWDGTAMTTKEEDFRYLHTKPLDVQRIENKGGNFGIYSLTSERLFPDFFETLLLPPQTCRYGSFYGRAVAEAREALTKVPIPACFVLEHWPVRDEATLGSLPTPHSSYLWPMQNVARYAFYKPYTWCEWPPIDKVRNRMQHFLENMTHIELRYDLGMLYPLVRYYLRDLAFQDKFPGMGTYYRTTFSWEGMWHDMLHITIMKYQNPNVFINLVITDSTNGCIREEHCEQPTRPTGRWGIVFYTLERLFWSMSFHENLRIVYRLKDDQSSSNDREIELFPDKDGQELATPPERNTRSVARTSRLDLHPGHPGDEGGGSWFPYGLHILRSPWLLRTMTRILALHGLPFRDECAACKDVVIEQPPQLPESLPTPGPSPWEQMHHFYERVTPFSSTDNLALTDSDVSSSESGDESSDEISDADEDDENIDNEDDDGIIP